MKKLLHKAHFKSTLGGGIGSILTVQNIQHEKPFSNVTQHRSIPN